MACPRGLQSAQGYQLDAFGGQFGVAHFCRPSDDKISTKLVIICRIDWLSQTGRLSIAVLGVFVGMFGDWGAIDYETRKQDWLCPPRINAVNRGS